MSKFVRVKEAPKTLASGEYVVSGPSFMEEVEAHAKRRPRGSVIGINYLRDILTLVSSRYADANFEPIAGFNLVNYKDRPAVTSEDDHKIVMDVIANQQPKIIHNYMDKKIQARPLGTDLIYYTGPAVLAARFVALGIPEISLADLKKLNKEKRRADVDLALEEPVQVTNSDSVDA